MWDRVEIYGEYIARNGEKHTAILTVELDAKKYDIMEQDIEKGKWEVEEILSPGWNFFEIYY